MKPHSNSRKIQTVRVAIDAKPGTLNRIFGAFKEAKVNIYSHWAQEWTNGKAEAVFYPADFNKATSVLSDMGFKPETGYGCYVEGNDQLGSYSEILAQVAKAGINLWGTEAFSLNGKYGTVLFTGEKDYTSLCKTLGC